MTNPWLTSLKAGADVATSVHEIYQTLLFLKSGDCPQPSDEDDPVDVTVHVLEYDDHYEFTDNPDAETGAWIETDRTIHLTRSN